MKSHPESSLPSGVVERTATEYRRDRVGDGYGEWLRTAECILDGVVVGLRSYDADDRLVIEEPRDGAGRPHGIKLTWHENGELSLAEPYHEGVIHGTARQWADDGRLIGAYTLTRGTGFDIWRCLQDNGTPYISEVTTWAGGQWHGPQWWFNENHSLWWERHFVRFELHGIEREWNDKGRLRRDSPKYWINGEKVRKRKYLRAADTDRDLPRFKPEEQEPGRVFPLEIQMLIGRAS